MEEHFLEMFTTRRPLQCNTLRHFVKRRQPQSYAHLSRSSKAFDSNAGVASKQKPKGSYTRIFATFAAGIPLGWAIHTFTNDTNIKSAKPGDFVGYTLQGKEDVSSTSSIFTLKAATNVVIDPEVLQDRRALTSVQFKQPQLQIARAYTVLPPVEGQDLSELRFLIRKERNGEVSGYIHRLACGSGVELRGPNVDYTLPEHVQNVLFLAGGTGVVPAMQIMDKLAGEADVHVLWATRKREDCQGGVSDTRRAPTSPSWNLLTWLSPFGLPAVDARTVVPNKTDTPNATVLQIRDLKSRSKRSSVDYFVDDESTFIRAADVTAHLQAASTPHSMSNHASRLIFVSGPEGFINHWAGPKVWAGGKEVQGPLGGVLSTLDLTGWTVVKL